MVILVQLFPLMWLVLVSGSTPSVDWRCLLLVVSFIAICAGACLHFLWHCANEVMVEEAIGFIPDAVYKRFPGAGGSHQVHIRTSRVLFSINPLATLEPHSNFFCASAERSVKSIPSVAAVASSLSGWSRAEGCRTWDMVLNCSSWSPGVLYCLVLLSQVPLGI